MIKILKADKKDSLEDEWHKVDVPHYGKPIEWNEESFRFKAMDNGKLVGTINGRHESGVIYIEALITKESERGRGIGTKLIKRAENFGKKFGAHRAWLITGIDWKENLFYKKLGFKKIGDLPDFHFHKDFVIYTREIKMIHSKLAPLTPH
jgi:GNAT superfamily N-acetyltransferase